jgi:hypothetical protein
MFTILKNVLVVIVSAFSLYVMYWGRMLTKKSVSQYSEMKYSYGLKNTLKQIRIML